MTNLGAPRRATARDVARESGVSPSTVSFVLNNTRGQTIPLETRDRVLEAAARLGYVPNPSAQILAGGRSRFVIIALGDLPLGDLVSSFERSAIDDLLRNGFIPVVAQALGSGDDRSLLTLAAALRPAAVLTSAPPNGQVRDALKQSGDPRIVHAFRSETDLLRPFATTGEAQAAHLAALGHRAICFVGTSDPQLERLVDARMQGVERACDQGGIKSAGSVSWTGDIEKLVRDFRALLAERPDVTGAVAYNDQVALAVLAAARALGISVPSDLAIVGADDLPVGRLVSPTLSSASYQLKMRSSRTVSDLLLSGDEVEHVTDVDISIIRREST